MASGYAVQDSSSFQVAQCAKGYWGHLCGRCEEGFGAGKPFRCSKCYNRGVLLLMYIVACMLLLAVMKLVCWLTLKGPSGAPAAQPSHVLRQLVLFAQYTLIIASVQAADSWPSSIAKPLEALAWLWAPASPHTLAPGCLSRSASGGVAATVFFVALPLVLLALLVLLEVLIRFVKGLKGPYQVALARAAHRLASDSTFKDQLLAASMVVIYFFLPAIVRSTFGLFACISVDQPALPPNMPLAVGSFWIHDTDQLCFVGWHRSLAIGLGIPLLLFVCFVPGFILYKTLPNRAKLTDPVWLQHYGFLVQDYKPGCRFWEAVVSAQTILLVAISVFSYTLGPFYQAVLMNVAVAVIWLLLSVVKPLAHKETQQVAFVSMGCLFLTSYSALAFVQMAGDSNGTELSLTAAEAGAIPSFMGVVVVVTNCAFLAWVLWKLMRMIEWKEQWKRVSSARTTVLALVTSASVRILTPRGSRDSAQGLQGLPTQVQSSHTGAGMEDRSHDYVAASDVAVRQLSSTVVELSSASASIKPSHGRDQDPDGLGGFGSAIQLHPSV